MAKSKSKNEIKIVKIKKNTNVVKKGANVLLVKSKPVTKTKKKISTPDIKEKTKNNITQDDIARRKERNRKKYQNQQKKYSESNKVKQKKKIALEKEEVKEKKVETSETSLVKKKKSTLVPKKKEVKKKEERREKRKTNAFAKTIVNIKTISADTINSVKEKADDRKIPVGKSKDEKKQRFKRVLKEAFIYAIILTIINVLLATFLDDVNYLRLFDVKILNVLVTIVVSLIFNIFIAFAIDYLITLLWLKIRRKKSGDESGNSRINEGEHKENIQDKEGE